MSTTVSNDSSHALYLQDIVNLNGSLVIKCNDAALIVNDYLIEKGYTVSDNKKEWKYYMHLNGEYHPTDTTMQVTSIDTLETIVFTKANLRIHKTTASEYSYGGAYYEELVSRYPNQEDLIKGILTPVDYDKAIEAEEGTILTYNGRFIEEQETNLIPKLQDYIYSYIQSSYNPHYRHADSLYLQDCLGKLYSLILQAIWTIRLENAKTYRAHSFHIWAHLASNAKMDIHRGHVNLDQKLFLYRNVKQLLEEAGTSDTFEVMVKRFLTDRYIPLYGYEMSHQLENFMDTYRPDVKYRKVPINTEVAAASNAANVTTKELLIKESALARNNSRNLEADHVTLERAFKASRSDYVKTKVLESEVNDVVASEEITYSSVALNHWLYWSTNGYYSGTLQIDNPFTGELMQVTPLDAFNLNFFFWNKANGVDLETFTIPDQVAFDVLRLNQHEAVQAALAYIPYETIAARDVEWIIAKQPTLKPVGNFIDFKLQAEQVLETIHWQNVILHNKENLITYGDMQHLLREFVGNYTCATNPKGETFNDLLSRLGYNFDGLSESDFYLLMRNTIKEAVGDILGNSNSLVAMQQAMMDFVRRLSSYDLQFIEQSSEAPNKNAPFSMGRFYDAKISMVIGGVDFNNLELLNTGFDASPVTVGPALTTDVEVDHWCEKVTNYEFIYDAPTGFDTENASRDVNLSQANPSTVSEFEATKQA